MGEVLSLLRCRAAICRWRKDATSSPPEQVIEARRRGHYLVSWPSLSATFTGELEPVAELCVALDKLAADNGLDIAVSVGAASGGSGCLACTRS